MVTPTLLYVTLYVHCLSCYKTSLGNLEKKINDWRKLSLDVKVKLSLYIIKQHAMNLCRNSSIPPWILKLDTR